MKELEYFTSAAFRTTVGFTAAVAVLVLVLNHLSKRYQNKIDPKDIRTRAFVRSIFNFIKGIIVLIGVFAVLQANGIQVTSMITGVGLVSVIGGLALQDMFKDIIMGLHIVNDHSIVVGEVVKINGTEGIVIGFSLLTTILRSIDTGDTVIMCNRNITEVAKSCGVYDINLNLAYTEDPEHVRDVLTKAAAEISENKGISRAEYLGIQDYAASAVVYKVRFYCSPKIHWQMWRAAMAVIQKHVIASGLVIPYPQYDVHMQQGYPVYPVSAEVPGVPDRERQGSDGRDA